MHTALKMMSSYMLNIQEGEVVENTKVQVKPCRPTFHLWPPGAGVRRELAVAEGTWSVGSSHDRD